MAATLLGQILIFLIIIWGFSVMFRPLFGGAGGVRTARRYEGGGTGFLGRFLLTLLFSVVLPVVWWLLALAGRLYHRSFVVFTEFLTGVHDWGTYRTSLMKYGGAFFAFVGFNGVLFLILSMLATQAMGYAVPALEWFATLSGTVGCCVLARTLMRRMP